MFQNTDSMTSRELMETTKLNSDQIRRTMQSLVDSKLMEVDTGEIFQPSTISLKLDFMIRTIVALETKEQKKYVLVFWISNAMR